MRVSLLPLLLAVPLLAGCLNAADPPPWPGAQPVPYNEGGEVMTTALPLLPLRVNERGEVEGVPTNLPAFAFCGWDDAPGLRAIPGDNVLRYHYHRDSVDPERPPWFLDRVGQPVRASDLAPGQGALASWRSEGASDADVLAAWVVRANRTVTLDPALDQERTRGFLADGGTLVAFAARSPWLCCTLHFNDNSLAARLGQEGRLFDSCHLPAFDPLHLVPARLPPCALQAMQPPSVRACRS